MKPHPRIRKTIKWGGAAVTVLLVVAGISSCWIAPFYVAHNGMFAGVQSGSISVGYRADWAYSGWVGMNWLPTAGNPVFWWVDSRSAPGQTYRSIPVWMPTLLIVYGTVRAWRHDRTASRREKAIRLNLCPKCNYDRTGLAKDAVCPECGAAAPKVG